MLDYQYSYLVGTLIFIVAWLILYTVARQHRGQMIWGSLLSAPFALTGFLFMPEYWSPPSLFDLDARFGIGIEDVLWSAAVGGIAAAASEIIFQQRLDGMRHSDENPRYVPLALIAGLFVLLEVIWPENSIYNMIIAFTAGAALIAYLRPDLTGRMLRGAAVFTVIYLVLFAYFLLLYPEFVPRYYNTAGLLGWYVFGIPVEEILFAYSGGAVWSVIFEYMQSYRLVSVRPIKFVRQAPSA